MPHPNCIKCDEPKLQNRTGIHKTNFCEKHEKEAMEKWRAQNPPVEKVVGKAPRWPEPFLEPESHVPISDQRLKEMKERTQKATTGPWEHFSIPFDDEGEGIAEELVRTSWVHGQAKDRVLIVGQWVGIQTYQGQNPSHGIWCEDHDAEFIAHARTDIGDLIAEVERLKKLLTGKKE
jgi:hypothetical protein